MKKRTKIMAVILIVLFLITVCLSYIFIIENAHHNCTGEDCTICMQLEHAEQFLSGLKFIPVLSFLMMAFCVFTQLCAVFNQSFCVKNTLVLLKVELLD